MWRCQALRTRQGFVKCGVIFFQWWPIGAATRGSRARSGQIVGRLLRKKLETSVDKTTSFFLQIDILRKKGCRATSACRTSDSPRSRFLQRMICLVALGRSSAHRNQKTWISMKHGSHQRKTHFVFIMCSWQRCDRGPDGHVLSFASLFEHRLITDASCCCVQTD